MAEDSREFKKAIAGLNISQAAQKVLERTAGRGCPFCGVEDWIIESGGGLADEDKVAPVFISKDPRSFFGPSPNVPAVAIYCGNCGFVRMHNVKVVNDGQ